MLKADKILDVQSVVDAATRLRVTEQTLRQMKQGQILKVVISDGRAKRSLAEMCHRLGCPIVAEDDPDALIIGVPTDPGVLREPA